MLINFVKSKQTRHTLFKFILSSKRSYLASYLLKPYPMLTANDGTVLSATAAQKQRLKVLVATYHKIPQRISPINTK